MKTQPILPYHPEPLEKCDTTPKIKANNLSKKALDIFKESLGISLTYKSPTAQITSKKLISTDQVSASFAASQSFDVQTDLKSSKETFENNEKKDNKSPTVQITSKKLIPTNQVSATFASQSLDVKVS